MPLPKCGAHADWCTRSRLRAHDSLDLGALRAVNRRTDCEAVAALEAIIEPLVQHDVAQPAIAEIACELRANRLEHRMAMPARARLDLDRKSTRLNSSHVKISYAVFCLKKKKLSQALSMTAPEIRYTLSLTLCALTMGLPSIGGTLIATSVHPTWIIG